MDITVYLPDDLGQWAKDAEINLSQTLRGQIEAERDRREAIAKGLAKADVVRLLVWQQEQGRRYTARLHGVPLHVIEGEAVHAYLGEDKKIYVYDRRDCSLVEDVDPGTLDEWLGPDAYIEAMTALGEEAEIDLGQAPG
jgi:post-segregation antitoxin (ccd killing protein)